MPGTPLTRLEVLRLASEGASVTRAGIRELHCIQPIANVPSILQLGILGHERAKDVPHVSIAKQEIQDRRSGVAIPGTDRELHDYANLYFNARNKMMSLIQFTKDVDEICVLRVSPEALDIDGVVIASENASTDRVIFAPAPGGLARIKTELVYARSWNHPDPIAKQLHGALICAEVLVPDSVPPELVTGAYVASTHAKRSLEALVPKNFDVTVNADIFFR